MQAKEIGREDTVSVDSNEKFPRRSDLVLQSQEDMCELLTSFVNASKLYTY